jgi:hypothetical protein
VSPGGARPSATWAEATSRLVVVGRRQGGRRRREGRGGGRDDAGCAAPPLAAAARDGGGGSGRRGCRAEVLAAAGGSPPSRPCGRREGHLGFSSVLILMILMSLFFPPKITKGNVVTMMYLDLARKGCIINNWMPR